MSRPTGGGFRCAPEASRYLPCRWPRCSRHCFRSTGWKAMSGMPTRRWCAPMRMRAGLVELRSSLLDAQTADFGLPGHRRDRAFSTLYDASRRTIDQTLSQHLPPRWAATRRVRRRSPRSNGSRPKRCGSWSSCATRVRGHSATESLKDRERAVMGDLQASVALLSEYQETAVHTGTAMSATRRASGCSAR